MKDREAWYAAVHGASKRHELATEQQLPSAVITVLLDSYKGVLVLGNENSFQGLYSERIILMLTVLKKKFFFLIIKTEL